MKGPRRLLEVYFLALLVAGYGLSSAVPTTNEHKPDPYVPDHAPPPCRCNMGTPGLIDACMGNVPWGFTARLRWELPGVSALSYEGGTIFVCPPLFAHGQEHLVDIEKTLHNDKSQQKSPQP
ncbi:uncharacterized protein PG998_002860 [Apiospora kogelbergensis]|uniref:Uncharacterized protein n=1 Tax=Apiospora kogelbergensis TaxID=1337665 RepID=A0AAW0QEH6_9PEZI